MYEIAKKITDSSCPSLKRGAGEFVVLKTVIDIHKSKKNKSKIVN